MGSVVGKRDAPWSVGQQQTQRPREEMDAQVGYARSPRSLHTLQSQQSLEAPLVSEPGDSELVAGIAAGDAGALTLLFARYRPRLWRYLWRQLDGDAPLAEDTLQEVFIAVWRTAGTFRSEAQVATWLFRIAHHHAANARRSRARRPVERLAEPGNPALFGETPGEYPHVAPLHMTPGQSAYRHAGPDEEVVARLTLAEALAQLSPQHHEVIDLIFTQGFSMNEVAAILDIPAGTVKSRLSYARRALRQHYDAATHPHEGGEGGHHDA